VPSTTSTSTLAITTTTSRRPVPIAKILLNQGKHWTHPFGMAYRLAESQIL
jgi:hypothetical protein